MSDAPVEKPRFRDSAAVVMIRGTGDALETFWVRRSDAVSVMPGFEAFVGGTVDPEDVSIVIEGAGDEAERLLRACAIREAFEETGVLLALDRPVDLSLLHAARRRLLGGEATFAALALEHGWRFRAAALASAGRWQTPVFANVRFDTLYFLSRLPEGQSPSVHVGELASGEWIRPAEAIARYKRGEATFAAPIYYTLEALLGSETGVIQRLEQAPERGREPTRRIELKWGVVLHPMSTRPLPPATHTNAYLVGEREMVLIDPGSGAPDELEQLFTLIDSLATAGRRLKMVAVTHHHSDHREGADAVRARYRVPVVGHPDAAKHLRLDVALQDGEWIPLLPGEAGDWNLHVLHTPGHTRDSLCLLHRRTRSLFCGDLIPGGRGTVIIDPPDGDMAQYLASLSRLLEEPVETLFPAHGTPQGAAMKRIRALIDHRLKRERLVLAALTREPQELAALVERVYADTPPELWIYAERSLLAHLLKLAAEGRAVHEGDRWREGMRA